MTDGPPGSAHGRVRFAETADINRLLADAPIGRMVGPDAMKFGGWQRLNAEYAQQFGVELPSWSAGPS